MTSIKDAQFLERTRFFDGQRLLAADFQTLESFTRQMRWLHNQSLHQPGIGSGYAVSGKKGDREVTVSPGYALDADGKEIILTAEHREAVPPVSGSSDGNPALYDLAVSYPSDDELKESETREGACLSRGTVRLREEPVFCWIQLADDGSAAVNQGLKERVHNGMLITLARIEIANCQLNKPVSAIERRNARPPKQPRIACGVAEPPQWRPETDGNLKTVIVFSANIDTVSGAFAATPSYTARLRIDGDPKEQQLFVSAISISDPQPTGFTIYVYSPFATAFERVLASSNTSLKVVWMGVEA